MRPVAPASAFGPANGPAYCAITLRERSRSAAGAKECGPGRDRARCVQPPRPDILRGTAYRARSQPTSPVDDADVLEHYACLRARSVLSYYQVATPRFAIHGCAGLASLA